VAGFVTLAKSRLRIPVAQESLVPTQPNWEVGNLEGSHARHRGGCQHFPLGGLTPKKVLQRHPGVVHFLADLFLKLHFNHANGLFAGVENLVCDVGVAPTGIT